MWRLKFNKRFLQQFECVTLTWLIFLNWHEYTIHCHKLGVTNYNHSLWLVSLYYQWKEASNPLKTPFQSEVILIKFKLVVIAFLLLSNLRFYTNTKSQKKVQNTRKLLNHLHAILSPRHIFSPHICILITETSMYAYLIYGTIIYWHMHLQ